MEFKRFFCALAAFLLVGTNIVSATPAFAADGDAEGDESMSEGAETDANINNLTEEEEPVEEDKEGEEADEDESEAEADEDEEEVEGGMSKSDLLKMQKERKKVAKNNSKFRR